MKLLKQLGNFIYGLNPELAGSVAKRPNFLAFVPTRVVVATAKGDRPSRSESRVADLIYIVVTLFVRAVADFDPRCNAQPQPLQLRIYGFDLLR